jgi:predicted metal-dependent HD superfamily phosphohydrolase
LDREFSTIYHDAIDRILPGLPKELSYHNIDHILDVLEQSQRIAYEEGIRNKEELLLLKTAALYHDSGFLHSYAGHEEAGCDIARKELPAFGINGRQLDAICGMIMATKIPQSPKNKLEEIICDADLDYLGRTDFFKIGTTLFLEMKQRGLVSNERDWNQIQVKFLKAHHYFTPANKRSREQQKLEHLALIERML